MDKEIKDYKDESNEEKNNNLINIEDEKHISNDDEIYKEDSLEKDEYLTKEDINTNEFINHKKQLEKKFRLTKKSINILLIICIATILLAINILKTVSKYENKTFPGTLIYEQDLSNLEKEEFLIEINKIEKNINKNKPTRVKDLKDVKERQKRKQ